ncbi:methyl-accepting chemotaxis protein [Dermatophilus congolensis]|nr:methyl-accepting chemotaxis protein [Dermatophilus congolensis]MBO3151785.1 methyl-accepting chemotaxis protein [Dermatophilus congolensis]MBO3161212.1 methyl-accepting chemotaxis protein [Dermatophilus congolensis]MBO3163067.1 methyl-accepting chemotaxis protein [Dermatophilus congolensis]MBO3176620.1 methyl-accepting chemotaxis protein [Dermatophilus congolensis]
MQTHNLDISGWQLGVLGDVYRLGAKRALSGEDAYNAKGFDKARASLEADLKAFPRADITNDERKQLDTVEAGYKEFFDAEAEVRTLYATENRAKIDQAAGEINGGKAGQAFTKIADASDALAASATTRATALSEQKNSVIAFVPWVIIAITIVLAGLIALTARMIALPIARSLHSVRDSLIAMSHNNLTVPADITTHDEVGETAQALEQSRTAMIGIITRVMEAAQDVADNAQNLTALSQNIGTAAVNSFSELDSTAREASNVDKNIQTVAAGTEEMTASIREIAKSTNAAAAIATQAVHAAETANAAVTQLGTSSAEIGEVVKTITGIAEQTNLLALNATIEAARAGEAGKGFAVVANEVKDLARETSQATENIGLRVETIQNDTHAAVNAINEIASIIAQIHDSQGTIASAVEEQTATTNEMSRSVNDAARGAGSIAQNVERTAQSSRSTSSTTERISEEITRLANGSASLRELVSHFHV